MLALAVTRQILMILENINLTRDLESKVAERTAELEGLGAIVNSSADAIVGKTLDGVITSWNPGAERIYGYSAAEAIGRHVSFIIPDDLQDEERRSHGGHPGRRGNPQLRNNPGPHRRFHRSGLTDDVPDPRHRRHPRSRHDSPGHH